MKISKRLESLANLVNKSDCIADIGCDHALLDIYLIKNNIVPKIMVSDINEKALTSGKENIQKYHLEDKIISKLGNGIETITSDINTLIISGMGTSTIIKILQNDKIKQINKLIIQSNNDYLILRKYLTKNNFYIADENVIYDKRKYYINIVFLRGIKKYSLKELKFGPILMQNNNQEYYNYLYQNNINILKKIPKHHFKERYLLIKENIYLKKLKMK